MNFEGAIVFTAMLRWLLVLLILAAPGLAHAQAKNGKTARPKIGDKVKVDWAGKEQVAEVVGYSGTGWITVKFNQNGREITPTLPPQQLRPVENGPRAAPAAEVRTWVDATGKFKIDAAFVELKDGVVDLRKADGATVTISLDKLSAADQELARKLASDEAARPDADNPFTTKPAAADAAEGRAATEKGSHTDTKNPAGLKTTEPDWSSGSEVLLDDSVREGSLAPDPEAAIAGPLANRGIPLRNGGARAGLGAGHFVHPKAYAMSPSKSQA